MNVEECRKRNHWIFENGTVAFCFLCDWRTDLAFALYSQQLLARVKTLDREQKTWKEAA